MTIIAALKENRTVLIGSDSLAIVDQIPHTNIVKMVKIANYVVAGTGTLNVLQIIHKTKTLKFNIKTLKDAYKFTDLLFEEMKKRGFCSGSGNDENLVHPFDLIIATPSKIFKISGDYTVIECNGFAASGCGEDAALGAYQILKTLNYRQDRVLIRCIDAAKKCNVYCGGKTKIIEVK